MRFTCIFLFLLGSTMIWSQEEALQTFPIATQCDEIEDVEEQTLCTQQFIMDWVLGHVVYSPEAKDDGVEGKVRATFVIDNEGRVRDVKITDSVHPLLDKEVAEAVTSLPDFVPATMLGKPISISYGVPVNFTIQD